MVTQFSDGIGSESFFDDAVIVDSAGGGSDSSGNGSSYSATGDSPRKRGRKPRTEEANGQTGEASELLVAVENASEAPREKGKRQTRTKASDVQGKAIAALFVTLFESLAIASLGEEARFTKEELALIQPSLSMLLAGLPVSVSKKLSNWTPIVTLCVGMVMWTGRQMEVKKRRELNEPVNSQSYQPEYEQSRHSYTMPVNGTMQEQNGAVTAVPPNDSITRNWGVE